MSKEGVPFLSAREHYDRLIDENNDPVRDSAILRAYMDGWDGDLFFSRLMLTGRERVLEVGIGTGRLAVKVIPHCSAFVGVDFSPKTIRRAAENLAGFANVSLIDGDYLTAAFSGSFDVIYSSLTLMHFEDKATFFEKTHTLLAEKGLFVLSVDKDRRDELNMGSYRVKLYPDEPEMTEMRLQKAAFTVKEHAQTAFAHIFVCEKATGGF